MAFIPLFWIPLRGGEFADIRTVFMARPDRVWRVETPGSDVVKTVFRPQIKDYLTKHFGKAGQQWINPQLISWMRYGPGYMAIAHGRFVDRKDREMQVDEFYALTKLACLEFVGWHTFVSLPMTYMWSPKFRALYLTGAIKRVAAGLVGRITARVRRLGWVKFGEHWLNPAQTRLIEKDQLLFNGRSIAVGFDGISEWALDEKIPGAWVKIEDGVCVNLRAIKDVKRGKKGMMRVDLGDSMSVDVPEDRSQTLLKECRRLGLLVPPKCGG